MQDARILIGFGLLLALGIGCNRRGGSDGGGGANGNLLAADELRIQIQGEPVSYDPALVEDGIGFRVVTNLYRGLLRVDESGTVADDLGHVVSVSKDGRTYEIELKGGVRWSDGVPLTSENVRYGIERALNPKRGSKFAIFLALLDGVADWRSGKTPHLAGIEIVSPRTVRFHLATPYPLFPGILTLPLAFPMRPDFLGPDGKFDLRARMLAFSAPYRLREYLPDQRIVIEAWDLKLGPGVPRKVTYVIVRDESTAKTLLDSARIDVLTRVSPYEIDGLRARGRLKIVPYAATYFLGFNLKDRRVQDVRLRRKIRDAIRREEIVGLTRGGETPAYSFLPPGFEGFWEFPHAKPLEIAATTKPKPWVGPPLELSFDGTERNQMIVEKIQADLKRVGIPISLVPHDWKTQATSVYGDPSAIYRFGWTTPLLDPVFFLLPFDRKGGFGLGGLPDRPDYHDAIEAIAATPSGPERRAKIESLQRRVLEDDVWVVPIYHYVSAIGVGERIRELPVNPLGSFRVEDVRLK